MANLHFAREHGVTRLDSSSVFRVSGVYRFILTAYILGRNIKTRRSLMHAYRQSRKLHFPDFITLNITRSIYSISARRFVPRIFKFQQTSLSIDY